MRGRRETGVLMALGRKRKSTPNVCAKIISPHARTKIQKDRLEREAGTWEGIGLSTWPPYDWGDVDPNTLGSPVIHLPGGAFVMGQEGEEP